MDWKTQLLISKRDEFLIARVQEYGCFCFVFFNIAKYSLGKKIVPLGKRKLYCGKKNIVKVFIFELFGRNDICLQGFIKIK